MASTGLLGSGGGSAGIVGSNGRLGVVRSDLNGFGICIR